MGTIHVDTGGNAANSGSTDNTSPLTGTTATLSSGSIVQLDSGTDLSAVVTTAGATQSSINIAGATNANRTVFWITAVSGSGGATPQVTLDVAPTGMTTNAWRIGGQYLWPSGAGVNVVEGALRAGDILEFNNSPATKTVTYLTRRTDGDSTTGFITVRGKAGTRPLLNISSGTVSTLTMTSAVNWYISNFELQQNGTVADVITGLSTGCVLDNIKVSKGPARALTTGSTIKIINSEFTLLTGVAISLTGGVNTLVANNYIHDNVTDGIAITSATAIGAVINNIIDTNGGVGLNISGAATTQASTIHVIGNTFYNNAVSGMTVADADMSIALFNNIFQNDGTHANVIWTAGNAELVSVHANNVFYASGGTNLTNLTANSTEFTTDPLMTAPLTGNFAISNSSPAAAAGSFGTPLGSTSVGYRDIGAIQRQAGTGGLPRSRVQLGH